METQIPQKHVLLTITSICVVGGIAYGGYMLSKLSSEQQLLSDRVASTTSSLRYYTSDTSETISVMQQKLLEISDALYENQQLTEELNDTVKSFDKEVSNEVTYLLNGL